jgi:hypothetical protein
MEVRGIMISKVHPDYYSKKPGYFGHTEFDIF